MPEDRRRYREDAWEHAPDGRQAWDDELSAFLQPERCQWLARCKNPATKVCQTAVGPFRACDDCVPA